MVDKISRRDLLKTAAIASVGRLVQPSETFAATAGPESELSLTTTAVSSDSILPLVSTHVDSYFLDIAGGWENNTRADTHEGTRRLVSDLRQKYPGILCCGEMHYDALMAFIPLFHVFSEHAYPEAFRKYCRAFQHLSHPAPGRGSSGVHESGFSHFDPQTLSLDPQQIPTITVVDDTFDRYRDVMAEIIARAKERPPES